MVVVPYTIRYMVNWAKNVPINEKHQAVERTAANTMLS